ncbi:MAG: 4-(cytidine 5'-diphospho)-2-C-methyl-D-erythritol kinase [Ruminococcaceae bacterium]|nr:4-(cytidine 5'-diphospho)-2-C-methyl-D-erythritol kinase [Oscillospiraceae bacterium]
MKTAIIKGYAKINLHLDVTGIMENGFHAVNNIMQSVSLCDTVTLKERLDGVITVDCNIDKVPKNESNLAYRAARLFCERTGVCIGADIYIEKHIPMAAGLAGGSADAAATLKGMNELCAYPLSEDELCAIGGELGSDIPFCIVGGAAFADEKGDVLHPFPKMPDCTIVIACGGEGVSTPLAYRMLDDKYDRFCSYTPADTLALRKAAECGDIANIAKNTFNIFEQPVLSVRPVAAAIKQAMINGGAIRAMMSGSGPSVFGIFIDEHTAVEAARLISALGVTPHICKPN